MSQTQSAPTVSEQMIEAFHRDGVVKMEGVISPDEAAHYRRATLDLLSGEPTSDSQRYGAIFHQYVDVWRDSEVLRPLTLHPRIGAIAEQLAGIPLRLWHDHTLAKEPGKAKPTAFHQDQMKWPFSQPRQTLSAWIALQDTPVERGCMSFLAGSHKVHDLPNIGTGDEDAWKKEKPELEYTPRITLPLKAGDCTFHHGMIMHAAGANTTADWRVAHVVIFADREAPYSGQAHVVTDPLGMNAGDAFADDHFPPVETFGQS
ncbi:MAG: phytanoyl-CoA dioxygenase family protein [Candidatus Latescibacteria bacterium]|nr:phytanoyl-CoA dioxygenase family protein [Candidatus Latescibacterota bacterium]